MRVLVISNPRATTTTSRQRDVVVRALASTASLQVAETANRGHAAALACRAMRDGVDIVVALGGDGTVNEVVNGLLTDGVHAQVPALGVVPGGSTNVFARAIGLPNDPVEATSMMINAITCGRRRQINLGKADDRWFVFAAGVGLDAAVVRAVEGHRRRGKRSTHALYVRTALWEYLKTDHHRAAITIRPDDLKERSGVFLAIITNCSPWTFLGNHPLTPTPRANFEDGLDVYYRTRIGLPSMMIGLSRVLRSRTKPEEFGAQSLHDLTSIKLRSDRAMPFQLDGEALGSRNEINFASVRNALSVLV